MFAKGRRGNLVFSDLIFSQLVLSLLLFSHPFIALGAGGRGFIPNQPKRYYDAFVKEASLHLVYKKQQYCTINFIENIKAAT